MNYPSDEGIISTRVVESRKIGYKFAVGTEFMNHLKVQEIDRYIYELWTHVRTVNLPPASVTEVGEIDITQPATWWQHTRRDLIGRAWGLRWTIRRWPIRMTTQKHRLRVVLNLERFHIYPEAPDFGGRLGPIVVPSHSLDTQAVWTGPNRKQGGPTYTEREK